MMGGATGFPKSTRKKRLLRLHINLLVCLFHIFFVLKIEENENHELITGISVTLDLFKGHTVSVLPGSV